MRLLRSIHPLILAGFLASCGEDSPTTPVASAPPADIAPGASTDWTLPGTPDSSATLQLGFQVDSGKTYQIKVKGLPTGATVSVVDANGSPIAFSKILSQSGKDSVTVQVPALRSGSAKLVVVGPGGTLVKVTETMTPGLPSTVIPPDIREPDSSRALSHPLPLDTWTQGSLHTGGQPDQDWFRLVTDPGWTYRIETKDSIRLYASGLSLFGRDSTPLALPAIGSIDWPSTSQETLWVRVQATDANGARYRIRATRTEGLPSGSLMADSLEDDDTKASASTIGSDSIAQKHTLHGTGTSRDTDWVRFPVDSGRTYVIWLARSNTSVGAMLWGTAVDSQSMARNAKSVSGEWVSSDTLQSIRSGWAFLRVNGSSPAGWRIAVTARDGIDSLHAPDPGEPDDSLHPQLLPGGSLSLVRRLDGNDTDWMAIDLTPNACTDLKFQNLDRASEILVRIQDQVYSLPAGASFPVRRCNAPSEVVRIAIFPRIAAPVSRIRFRMTTTSTTFPVDPLESDPDSLHSANLVYDAPILHRWVMQGDQDWMQIPVDSGRNVWLEFGSDTSIGEGRFQYEILGPDGYSPDLHRDTYTDQPFYEIKKSGFLRIGVTSTVSEPQGYSIRAHAFAWDSLAKLQPRTLRPDSSAGQALLTELDNDAFDVPVQAGRSYAWSARSQGNVGVFGYWQAPAGVLKNSSANFNDSNGVLVAATDGIVRFYVKNSYYRLLLAQPNPATLRVWPIQEDPHAADSTSATARPLVAGAAPITGTLVGDQAATFSFPIDTNSRIRFTIVGTVTPKLHEIHDSIHALGLHKISGTPTGTWEYVADGFPVQYFDTTWHTVRQGTAILKLRGTAGQVNAYSVSMSQETGDAYEPDDSRSRSILLDQPQAHTLTIGDLDSWNYPSTLNDTTYAFTLDCAIPLDVMVSSGGQSLTPTLTTAGTRTAYHFRTVHTNGLTGGTSNDISIRVHAPNATETVPYTAVLRVE